MLEIFCLDLSESVSDVITGPGNTGGVLGGTDGFGWRGLR